MTKQVLLFATKFVALSVPLVWLWMEWGRGAYGRFLTSMAQPIYELLALEIQPGGARERYINYIPFLVLMFITPRLSIARRVMGTIVGAMAIFTFHLIFDVWVQIAYPGGGRGNTGIKDDAPIKLVRLPRPKSFWETLSDLGAVRMRDTDLIEEWLRTELPGLETAGPRLFMPEIRIH